MLRNILLGIVLSVLFLTGCAQSEATAYPNPTKAVETPNAITLPSLSGNWNIKFTHSGGIMGLLRSIEISSNGSYTVKDERTKKSVSLTLDAAEMEQLKTIVSSSTYIAPDPKNNIICADCFVFDLEIAGSDSNFKTQLNDISLPASGLEDLIDFLRSLMDTALG